MRYAFVILFLLVSSLALAGTASSASLDTLNARLKQIADNGTGQPTPTPTSIPEDALNWLQGKTIYDACFSSDALRDQYLQEANLTQTCSGMSKARYVIWSFSHPSPGTCNLGTASKTVSSAFAAAVTSKDSKNTWSYIGIVLPFLFFGCNNSPK
jgi:hypothetical protein